MYLQLLSATWGCETLQAERQWHVSLEPWLHSQFISMRFVAGGNTAGFPPVSSVLPLQMI